MWTGKKRREEMIVLKVEGDGREEDREDIDDRKEFEVLIRDYTVRRITW